MGLHLILDGSRYSIQKRVQSGHYSLQVGKRFFKADDQSQDAQTGFFAKLAAKDKVAMKRAEEERLSRKVALTRNYRQGDLPDIQVQRD